MAALVVTALAPSIGSAGPPSHERLGGAARNAASKHPKLTAVLDRVARIVAAKDVQSGIKTARLGGLEVKGGGIRVELLARARVGAVRRAVTALGGEVETTYAGWVVARVPPNAIGVLAARGEVAYIRTPHMAEPQAVAGEGVGASGAAAWHAAGLTGAGVKVAIIDAGFDGYLQSVANGDLSATTVPVNIALCAGTPTNPEKHGTGVAEIVQEMAPGAQLYLICGGDSATFKAAVDYAIANGIHIFNASLGWKNTSRGDGSGSADTPDFAVKTARQNGVLPVISAGNDAEKHWMGAYSDTTTPPNHFHNFNGGDETINVMLKANERLCVYLKWDDWTPPVNDDYDLRLYNSANVQVDGNQGSTYQNGGAGQTPTEGFCYRNTGGQATFHIAIYRYLATVTPRFDLFIDRRRWPEVIDEYNVEPGSLLEPSSSPFALSVAAICWQNNALEPYSSRGPTIDGRVEPDIAGQSAVSSYAYGPFAGGCGYALTTGFNGTSAASPHVAGAAALVKQANPSFGPDAIQSFLEARGGDLGAPGKDNDFGFGRLSLGAVPSGGTAPDTTPPSVPPGLSRSGGSQSSISVAWGASSDDRGTAGYGLYLNGASAGTTGATGHTFGGLNCGAAYTIEVDAFDATGNRSGRASLPTATDACPATTRIVAMTLGGPRANFQRERTFQVNWRAVANTARYDIQYRAAKLRGIYGSWVSWKSNTPATSTSFTGRAGMSYCFRVRANPQSGYVSEWTNPRCTSVPVSVRNRSMRGRGGWRFFAARGRYLNAFALSSRRGATLGLTGVRATRLALVATKCPRCGSVNVYWNKRLLASVRLTSASVLYKQVIEVASFASQQRGGIRIVVTSRGKPVAIEGLGVFS
jgi:subtilisin family serine protease